MTTPITPEQTCDACPISNISNIDERFASSGTLECAQSQSDFTVLWNNLTYKANSRRWYTRAKEQFFSSSSTDADSNKNCNENGASNSENTTPKGEKIILNRLCGYAKSRQLTAIMGPSGAGKSTLLHCLFQSRTEGATGQILVESRSRSKLKVCFIPQHDYLNEWLTVREDLMFVSKLKLARVNGLLSQQTDSSGTFTPENSSSSEADSYVRQGENDKGCKSYIDHEANALRVAELLGLNNCLDVTIKNISGGQKKRLSIARELMSKPDILILDEPTTGLDSLTCYKTIIMLRDLAHLSPNPMAVVMTIHQPQREVFNLFDKTYFISSKGSVIFEDNPKLAKDTIESIAKIKLPSPNHNPASFLIEIASNEQYKDIRQRLTAHQRSKFYQQFDGSYLKRLMRKKSNQQQSWKFCALEDKSSFFSGISLNMRSQANKGGSDYQDKQQQHSSDDVTIVKVVDESSGDEEKPVSDDHLYISHQIRNCLSSHKNTLTQSFRHVFILTHRSWLSLIRNPTFTKSRLVFHSVLPLLMLAVFGGHFGSSNACPKVAAELSMEDMAKSIKDGVVAKNVEETRLCIENMSFFFILMYGFGINLISCTASFYPLTMHMFKKETINGLYSSGPYFIGQMLAELPLEIFFPTLSIIISYPLSGQIPSFMEWRMFTIAYIVFLVSYSIHALGLLCGAIFINDISVAVLLGQVLLLPQVMLSGFLIRPTRMPDWMIKLSYASSFKNGMFAIVTTRYGFNACNCDEDMLPEDGESVGLSGLTPNVKHVLEYLFPIDNKTNSVNITEVFDQLGQRFVKSQTYGLDIRTCEDVKPYLMHVFDITDFDLFISIAALIVIIAVLKLVTYSIMKSFPYRII